jgi:hypothetical protein
MRARGFGCKAYVGSKPEKKLDPKARIARWIGLSEETKGGHIIYWPEKKSVTIERNVRFVDGTAFVGEDETVVTIAEPSLNLQNSQESDTRDTADDSPKATQNSSQSNPLPSASATPLKTDSNPSKLTTEDPPEVTRDPMQSLDRSNETVRLRRSERATKLSPYVRQLLEQGQSLPRGIQAPKPAKTPSEMMRPSTVDPSSDSKSPGAGRGALAHGSGYAKLANSPDIIVPRSRSQALSCPQKDEWREAESKEHLKLIALETYTLAPRSEAKTRPIPLKWVYDTKRDGNGNVIEYKARVVVRGDKQERFLNFDETFSSVLKSTTRNILLAIAADMDWHIRQSDFKSAYLNGVLDEDIYTEQPPGYEVPGKEDYVCKLKKALYGLKQAGRVWYLAINKVLTEELGFTRAESDHALFYRYRDGNQLYITLHVDDSLTIGNNLEEILEVERQLDAKFPLKCLGDAHHYLGITIERDRNARSISLGQTNYIDGLVSFCNLEDAKPAPTPLPLGAHFGKEFCPSDLDEIINMRRVPFREVVGGLMYIANGTRPDISYSTNILAQVASNPGHVHWEAAKHLVRYLKGTRNHHLTYGGGVTGLYGYTDASHASQDLNWKSMSGYAFMVNGGAVSWSAKKQPIIALSTTESEYIAMTHATKELLWIRSFLSEVFRPLQFPIQLFADNQSAIAMAKNDSFHPRTKHIAIRYHFIRHHVTHNHLSLSWIDTHSNCADLFTKVLDKAKTSAFAQGLGILPT